MAIIQQNLSRKKASFFIRDILESEKTQDDENNDSRVIKQNGDSQTAKDSQGNGISEKSIALDLRCPQQQIVESRQKLIEINPGVFVHGQGFPFKCVQPLVAQLRPEDTTQSQFRGFPERVPYQGLSNMGYHGYNDSWHNTSYQLPGSNMAIPIPLPVYVRTRQSPDDVTGRPKKHRRCRTVFSELQLMGLERRFETQKYLSTPDRSDLAKSLGLTQIQVKTWYQNRRMKWKKQVIQKGGKEPPIKPKGRPRKNESLVTCEDVNDVMDDASDLSDVINVHDIEDDDFTEIDNSSGIDKPVSPAKSFSADHAENGTHQM